ncbi:MAG: GIY-YIG nuclease family protein [Planctomycetota bacterium]|jgi:hypothetical protein
MAEVKRDELENASVVSIERRVKKEKYEGLPSTYTAEEVSERVDIRAERLTDLANADVIPHWRIDGGQPLFKLGEVYRWIAENCLKHYEGRDLPFELRIVREPPTCKSRPPKVLSQMVGLREIPLGDLSPGVYFLCNADRVLYVGQSVNPGKRISEHLNGNGCGQQKAELLLSIDRVYLLPLPEKSLGEVEGALIRHLRPPLNGARALGEFVEDSVIQEIVKEYFIGDTG